jgi:glycine betaine/proline transport system substrate-binding protein
MKHKIFSKIAAAAVGLSLAVTVAGCGSSANSTSSETGDKTIKLGQVAGWNDAMDLNSLYKYVLESNGYKVDVQEFSEISTIYIGAARGDLDAFSSSPDTLHKDYWEKNKDNLENLGAYYDNAAIFLAVPDYVTNIQSLEDLPSHAGEVEGKIVGIEPGSGLTKVTQEQVFPAYGLGDALQLQTSSTAAMVAELKKATEAKKPIVVSMWSPYWPNTTFSLRKLEDPKEAFGKPYTLNTITRKGLSEDFPEVVKMMSKVKLTDEQFGTLDDAIFNQFKPGQEQEAVKAWAEKNPEVIKELEEQLKS